MKKILLLLCICFEISSVFAQQNWDTIPQAGLLNPDISEFTLVNEDIYAVVEENNQISVQKFNNYSRTWQTIKQQPSIELGKLKLFGANSKLWIIGANDGRDTMYVTKFDIGANEFELSIKMHSPAPLLPNNDFIDNWKAAFHPSTNRLFVGTQAGGFVHSFYMANSTWAYELMSFDLDPTATEIDVHIDEVNEYISASDYSSTNPINRRFLITKIGGTPTNPGSSVEIAYGDPITYLERSSSVTMNGINASNFHMLASNVNTTIGTLEIIPGTLALPLLTQLRPVYSNYAKTNTANSSLLLSDISGDGSNSTPQATCVLRKNAASSLYSQVGANLEVNGTYGPDAMSISVSSQNEDRILVNYKDAIYDNKLKILNNIPALNLSPVTVNACANQSFVLYPEIAIFDADPNSKISIISCSGFGLNAFSWEALPTSTLTETKFKITAPGLPAGTINSAPIVITFTDGFVISTFTALASVNVANFPNPVTFTNPLELCSNIEIVNFNDYVNYAGGIFAINGEHIIGSETNISNLITTTPVEYKVAVGNCIFSQQTNVLIIPAPTVSLATAPTTCISSAGQVTTSAYTGGGVPTYLWSTGATTPSLTNLSTGTYTLTLSNTGCSSFYTASVASTDVTIAANIINASCAGDNDGSITLSGIPPTAGIVWMDGQSGPTATQLTAGDYWVNIDNNGCNLSSIFTVLEPAPISITFTEFEPDCAALNGRIFSLVSGGNAPYVYLWEDGSTNDTISGLPYGFYNLEIMDANGCKADSTFALDEWQAVGIEGDITPTACGFPNGSIDLTFTPPTLGTGFAVSATWSDATSGFNRVNLENQHYQVDVVTNTNCHSIKDFYIPLLAPAQQEICIVSVDTATTTNLVIWEKNSTSVFDYYNIYRENFTTGSFEKVDTISYQNLSVFNDQVAFADERAWKYQISAVDFCGAESPRSTIHQTMYLNCIILGTLQNEVYWNTYQGGPVSGYKVLRKSAQNGWELITTVSALTGSFVDDSILGLTDFDYLIELLLPATCNATFGKANSYRYSRSNKQRGVMNPGEGTDDPNNALSEIEELGISIYPNPSSGIFTVAQENSDEIEILVTDLQGKVVKSLVSKELEFKIDLSDNANGIYFVQLKSDFKVVELKLTKM